MYFKKQKIAIIVGLSLLLAIPLFASASGLVPCGGTVATATDTGKPCTVQDIFSLVARVTNWLILFAGVYAVYEIVTAGFWLTISSGNEENITKWKNGLSNAVVGFVFVMMAYLLINTAVNFLLLNGAPCNEKVDLAHPFNYLSSSPPSDCSKVGN